MRGREKARFRRRVGLILVAALASMLALGVASPAVAKKKKKKAQPAVTVAASAPFSSGTNQSLTSNCSKGTHISGGGFAASPTFEPTGPSGIHSASGTSNPAGPKSWTAATAAFATPNASGQFSAIARCESDKLGQLSVLQSSTLTLPPSGLTIQVLNCPGGSHVISGGYAGNALGAFNYAAQSFRLIMLQSQRTGPGQWTVTVANNQFSPQSADVTIYALCEKNAKGLSISEASVTTGLTNDQRAAADASCTGKTHVVSGGFKLSPIPTTSGSIPVTEIDEFEPSGKKAWHTGLYEITGFAVPPGSSLQTTAYCKKDAVAKKKK